MAEKKKPAPAAPSAENKKRPPAKGKAPKGAAPPPADEPAQAGAVGGTGLDQILKDCVSLKDAVKSGDWLEVVRLGGVILTAGHGLYTQLFSVGAGGTDVPAADPALLGQCCDAAAEAEEHLTRSAPAGAADSGGDPGDGGAPPAVGAGAADPATVIAIVQAVLTMLEFVRRRRNGG